jgi:type VI protein secretion system component Hcp
MRRFKCESLRHTTNNEHQQQVRVHWLKISIQGDVLFLLAMLQQVRVHRLKISIQEDVLFLLAMSQQVNFNV